MARQGFFGEIVHGECAYSTSKMGSNFSKTAYWEMWWLKQYANRKGNIYPTHGLGPVCQIMDINRGDKLDFLVSVESKDFMMGAKAKELAKADDFYKPFVDKDYRGNMNTTIIKTTKGRTIMLQHDATSPSPHNLIHGIYGTKGAALYDPQPPRLSVGDHQWVSPETYKTLEEKYTPNIIKKMGEASKRSGHGGSDLLIDWRLIDCLRNGLALDQDVYDAVSWSSIVPLSEWSVNNKSNSIEIHTTTMGYMDYVNLHVSCAIRNCEYFELFVPEAEFMFPMKNRLPVDEGGIIHVGDEPGAGAEIDWQLVDKCCASYLISTWDKTMAA